jgi:predicted dehydrogenase
VSDDNITDRPVRLGIIGVGTIAQNVHIPSIQRHPELATLVALCDVDVAVARRVAAVSGNPGVFGDHRQMMAECELDAVLVTVADSLHVRVATDAIHAGLDVFVEKPLASNLAEAVTFRELVARTDRVVQVGNMRRYDPGVVAARVAVAEVLGEVLSFNAWYRSSIPEYSSMRDVYLPTIRPDGFSRPAWKNIRDSYPLFAHGSHLFDHIRFVVGAPQELSVIRGQVGEHYTWQGLMRLPGGGAGRFELSYETAAPWSEGVEVYGTRGAMRLDMSKVSAMLPSTVEIYDSRTRITSRPSFTNGNLYANQLVGFVAAVRRQAPAGATAADGVAVMRDIEAVQRSLRGNGIAVDVTGRADMPAPGGTR